MDKYNDFPGIVPTPYRNMIFPCSLTTKITPKILYMQSERREMLLLVLLDSKALDTVNQKVLTRHV